jgi:hypothetical protein
MNITRQRIVKILIITFMALMMFACDSMYATTPGVTILSGPGTLAPGIIGTPNPASAYAQATIDTGRSQLLDLSLQATQVSLNMSQAANAAAQSTLDFNQRQKLALDFQATAISQNIARAAATQQFLTQQTKIARDATAAAQRSTQSSAAAAAQSAYRVVGSQTAQAQAVLNAQVLQTDQAVAALTAAPLTATPYAATQAALLMQEYSREQQSFINQIVKPLIPVFAVLDLVLFILGIVLISRQFMPMPWPRRMRIGPANVNPAPLTIIDGRFAGHDQWLDRIIPSELRSANLPVLPGESTVFVEMVSPDEPPIVHWIAEVEQQLANEGGLQL